jgi:hypothetical protein
VTRRLPPTADQIEQYRLRSLSEYGPRIQLLLQPGEPLRVVAYGNIMSIKDPPRRYLPAEHGIRGFLDHMADVSMKLDDVAGDALFGLLNFLARTPPDFRGGWDSQAGRFVIAVSGAAKQNGDGLRHLFLAVTDRRVLLAAPPPRFLSRSSGPARFIGDYQIGQIGLHTGKRRGTDDDEVVLGFPDRSYVSMSLNGFPSSRLNARLEEERAAVAVLSQLLPPMAG